MEEGLFPKHERVEVRNRFDGGWGGYFEVTDVIRLDDGRVNYLVRRLSDGASLPSPFWADEVRAI